MNKTVEEDGTINASMVVTGIPSKYYNLVLTAKMKIEYTLADGTVCTLEEEVFRSRSVNQVVEKILGSVCREKEGENVGFQFPGAAEDAGALHRVSQLTHVTRPIAGAEQVEGLRRDSSDGKAVFAVGQGDKV